MNTFFRPYYIRLPLARDGSPRKLNTANIILKLLCVIIGCMQCVYLCVARMEVTITLII